MARDESCRARQRKEDLLRSATNEFVRTDSFTSTFGEDCVSFLDANAPGLFVTAEEVAGAVVALSSGLMDAVRGQTIMVDRGTTFCDNVMRMYDEQALAPGRNRK